MGYVKKEGEEVHDLGHKHIKAATWCEKVPKKICAPDHCNMIPGPEECHDKTIVSTIVKPGEICDLQPTTECQVVTNLIPHLIQKPICEDVPKEFCHAKLDSPKLVKKPITMKWCTFPDGGTPTTLRSTILTKKSKSPLKRYTLQSLLLIRII